MERFPEISSFLLIPPVGVGISVLSFDPRWVLINKILWQRSVMAWRQKLSASLLDLLHPVRRSLSDAGGQRRMLLLVFVQLLRVVEDASQRGKLVE